MSNKITKFIKYNVAPYVANHIGIFNENNEKVGQIPLNNFKPSRKTRLYRFGLLSDVHRQEKQESENDEDFTRALTLFNNREDVDFVAICGDITENGTQDELNMYSTNVSNHSPNTKVYVASGNHDATTSGLNATQWKEIVGNARSFAFTHNNDIFYFLGMKTWSLGSNGTPYDTTDISWLTSELQKNPNARKFIFTHLFFPDYSGNYGEYYPTSNWLGGTQLSQLKSLIDSNEKTIWFSGHSHWKWYLQEREKNSNVYKVDGGGYAVHIPSCASPIDSGGNQGNRWSDHTESEGAIVDVYDDCIEIRGIDLKNDKYLPVAQYILPVINGTITESIIKEI